MISTKSGPTPVVSSELENVPESSSALLRFRFRLALLEAAMSEAILRPSEAVRSARWYLAVTALVGEVYNRCATAELLEMDLLLPTGVAERLVGCKPSAVAFRPFSED